MFAFIYRFRPVLAAFTMCCVGVYGQTSPSAGKRTRPDTPELVEMRNFRLSMDKIDKFGAASQTLVALSKTNPAMKSSMEGGTGAKTVDEGAKQLQAKYPEAAAAIQKAGLSVHDYLMTSLTLMSTIMVAGMKRQGQKMDQLPGSVSPENLAFVEQNYPKLEKLLSGLSRSAE